MAAVQGGGFPAASISSPRLMASATRSRHAVAVIRDADECHDETLVRLHGGAIARVP
jgi:hypothetical protein